MKPGVAKYGKGSVPEGADGIRNCSEIGAGYFTAAPKNGVNYESTI